MAPDGTLGPELGLEVSGADGLGAGVEEVGDGVGVGDVLGVCVALGVVVGLVE